MQDFQQELKKITDTLLSPELNYNNIRMAAHALKDLFCKAVGYDEAEAALQQHIQSAGGQAINTYTAALCITDMMRTRKFLLGIKEAIEERLKTNAGKPVIVFYAGSGPFATLLTPLTTIFDPDQLQMVLLEINPASIDYLHKTIQQFGLEKYMAGIEQADAVHYIIPDKYQPDILLSETMKPALQKEPQVNIITNLLPQCKNDPLLIPSTIIVEACLVGNLATEPLEIVSLGRLLDLNKVSALTIHADRVIAEGIMIELKEKPSLTYRRMILNTRVHIYGKHILGLQESGITLLEPVMELEAIEKYPAQILFKYRMKGEPGFEFNLTQRR